MTAKSWHPDQPGLSGAITRDPADVINVGMGFGYSSALSVTKGAGLCNRFKLSH